MGFLLLPLSACSACVILNTWLLSPVPFPPNAHLVNVSSCLHALTLHVPESSMPASPGQLGGHVASQNLVNVSSLCQAFPLFWGKRETRETVLQVLTFGELLNFSFLCILIDKVPKDKVLTWERERDGRRWGMVVPDGIAKDKDGLAFPQQKEAM